MRRVREILRLKHECGASDRAIGRSLGVARSTVALTLDRVAAAGSGVAAAGDAERPRAGGDALRRAPAPGRASGARSSPTGPTCTASCAGQASRSCCSGRSTGPGSPTATATAAGAISTGPGKGGCRRPCGRRTRPASACSSIMPGRRSRSSTAGPARCAEPRSSSPRWVPPATPTPRRPGRRRCPIGSARTPARSPSWAGCRRSWCRTTRGSGSIGRTGTSRG